LELEDVFKEKAKENLILSGKLFGELHNKANIIENDIQEGWEISPNPLGKQLPKIEPIETRKELAKVANVSDNTISKVKVIEAKATPEVKEQLLAGDISINEAYKEIKQEEKRAELLDKVEIARAKISEAEKLGVPDSFGVVVIDPPWDYSERGGFVTDNYNADSNRGAVDYPTMTISEIAKIQIPAADDCVLFLWTTHKFLEDSFSLIRGWGFDYKATIVWDKMKMGIGRTIRLQCEFCLLATKGNPIILGGSERDIISEARREHSRKPEAFYSMVERMTVGSKIDYFSREYRLNWFSYGAELGKF
jgi:N6-adenosine-specific RNA methylase IME4